MSDDKIADNGIERINTVGQDRFSIQTNAQTG